MAICVYCLLEMTTARSCTVDALHLDGRRFRLGPHGTEPGMSRFRGTRCGDCGVAWGGLHHPGCDLQRCPRCDRQLLSCGCWFDEDGPRDDDEDDDDSYDALPWDEPPALGVDVHGNVVEHGRLGGVEVVVHYADYPDSDITTVQGIRCTTAVRTIIDVAPMMDPADLRESVTDAIDRGLFTATEAWDRLARPDMTVHVGAEMLRAALRTLH